jgi:hypothetical protein
VPEAENVTALVVNGFDGEWDPASIVNSYKTVNVRDPDTGNLVLEVPPESSVK